MSPYVNGVLLAILRPALAAFAMPLDPAEQVGSAVRADYIDHLPFVWTRATPGGLTSGPRMDTRFGVPAQIDVYAPSLRAAGEVADACVSALHSAWKQQTVTADGYIARLGSVSGPHEFRESDRADGVKRTLTTFLLSVRPPAAP